MITEREITCYAMVFCKYLENFHASLRMLGLGLQGAMTACPAYSLCSLKSKPLSDLGPILHKILYETWGKNCKRPHLAGGWD